MTQPRRTFLRTSLAGTTAGLWLPAHAQNESPSTANPTAALKIGWTDRLLWHRVLIITSLPGEGTWDKRLANAQEELAARGGGVVYFPAGDYEFADHILLKNGIILRGADPKGSAHDSSYAPPSRIQFPRFKPIFTGQGTPLHTAFKGIHLEDPATAANCAVVNLSLYRGHIHFGENDEHRCGGNRIVFGCVLRNTAVADPGIPNAKYAQHAWQRFTARHHAAIDVKGSENILVANNRLPKSGEDNFAMDDFILKPHRKGAPDRFDGVVFDYDNRPGLYISHYCVGGAGGSGEDGTPKTHPWGFRKGIVIRDNYVYNTGRMGIGFCGDGVVCSNNVIRFEKDVWRPSNTGYAATSGSSTNDNRAIEMRGWRWVVDGNDYEVHRNWCADKSYLINDGEGLMHEDHCNSTIRDSRLTNNKGNSYLSIYKCGPIDGLLVEGNDLSTPGKIADIYVVASRNSGPQPCRRVTIAKNTTRSNGILIEGSPASDNLIRDNRHAKGTGFIANKAAAKLSGNKGYETPSD